MAAESKEDRHNRELIELLNELRVALPGLQVLFAFLLAVHRQEYRFRSAGVGKDRNRPVFLIDFASVERKSTAELIEDKAGHDDCFDWTGHVASRGRVWVDAKSFDVVRIERGLPAMLDVRVPLRIQRWHNLENVVVIDREDTTIRYRTVAFNDPDELLLLPESIETLMIARGGLQSTRRSQIYSDYHFGHRMLYLQSRVHLEEVVVEIAID